MKEILEEGRFTIFIDDIDSQKSEELKILNKYIDFNDQDVLFMYSILTINNSFSIR